MMPRSIQARPTIYRGLRMRSRLEARYAAFLDRQKHLEWFYEPRAYANEAGQYLPDFELHSTRLPGKVAFIEVKPTLGHAFMALERMQIIWSSDPNATLMLDVPGAVRFQAGPGDRRWRVYPTRAI